MAMHKETRLILAICLSLLFMIIEVVGGYISNSIAIYSDAAHLLTDIAGFGIALIATITARAPGNKHLTFGLARAEVFGALGSILSLWIITAFLLYAAFLRACAWFEGKPESVDGFLMFIIACFGILVNICLGLVFSDEHGGAFHPAHSHDHGHESSDNHDHSSNASYQKVEDGTDIEMASHHGHNHSHISSKNHDHEHATKGNMGESTHLLSSSESNSKQYGGSHDHSHSHQEHTEHCDDGHRHTAHEHSTKIAAESGKSSHHGHDHSHGHHGDVNIEAAYLHVLTDLIQSIGVAIAGLLMWFYPHWQIIDPFCTLLFSMLALKSTIPLMQRVFLILFDGTPSNLDWELVMSKFEELEGVEDVHDLHIWSISSSSVSLTCHMRSSNPQLTLLQAHNICRSLGIDHATIQVHDSCDERFCYSQTCDDDEVTGIPGKCHKNNNDEESLSRSNSKRLNKKCFSKEKLASAFESE